MTDRRSLRRIEVAAALILAIAASVSISHGTPTPTVPVAPDAEYGLGAILEPPAAAAPGEEVPEPPAALAPAYRAPNMPPVLNQGLTPQCVAYSSAALKAWQDWIDQGHVFFNFDKPTFFVSIGGGPNGAYESAAMSQMRNAGYPEVTHGNAFDHRIAKYWIVPKTVAAVKAAILAYGPVAIITPWYHSWSHPIGGVLPAPDYVTGGHSILAYGWDDSVAGGSFRLRNSWGTAWGLGGDAWMPYAQVAQPYAFYATVDVNDAPPPPPTPVPTPVPTPTAFPTPEPTATPSPTVEPTLESTPIPTEVVTPVPTAVPATEAPTATASSVPSASPPESVSPTPSASPSPGPTPPPAPGAPVGLLILVLLAVAAGIYALSRYLRGWH